MAAEHLPLVVACAQVQMRIVGTVHRIDGPGQRDNFIIAGKVIGIVLLFSRIEDTDREVVGCAERTYRCEPDMLLFRHLLHLFENLLTRIHPDDDRILETSVLHKLPP